jgi:hypothetical protein
MKERFFKYPLMAEDVEGTGGGDAAPIEDNSAARSLLEGQETPAPKEGLDEVITTKEDITATKITAPETLENKEWWDEEKGALKTDAVLEELGKRGKIAADLRKKLSKGVKVPEKAEEYNIAAAEGLETVIDPKAPIFSDIKTLAHGLMMSEEQINGFVNGYMKICLDKGIIKKPLSKEEQEKAQKNYIAEERKKLGDNPDTVLTTVKTFIDGEYRKGTFNEAEKKYLNDVMGSSSTGIIVINKLREMTGQPTIPVDNAAFDGLPPDNQLLSEWGNYTESKQMEVLKQRIKLGRPIKFLG